MHSPLLPGLAVWVALLACGCSSAPSKIGGTGSAASSQGPAVIYARPETGIVELNREFQPMKPAAVLADIKDPSSRVSNVVLQFSGIPLEVPMENLGGSVWRAQLMPRQLEMLSVSGQTIRYEAKVVARDEKGDTASSSVPVELAIKTPDVTGAG